MTTVAVIQARCGSSRFPGKVLADLAGRPLLEHVVRRVQRAERVHAVVVATTDASLDDEVGDLCARLGVTSIRGPVDDVLTRYVLALRAVPADVVVRITADCPLVDPVLVDSVVDTLDRERTEYANNIDPPSYPDGYDVEVMTAACLGRLDREGTRSWEREHVTAYAREHPQLFQTAHVHRDVDASRFRVTVDLPADLDRVRRIVDEVGDDASVETVIALLEQRPDLSELAALPERDASYLGQRRTAAAVENGL